MALAGEPALEYVNKSLVPGVERAEVYKGKRRYHPWQENHSNFVSAF